MTTSERAVHSLKTFVLLLLLLGGAAAQHPGGTITGVVTDATGARIAHAQVEVIDTASVG